MFKVFAKWDSTEDYVLIPTLIFTTPPEELNIRGWGFCIMFLKFKMGFLKHNGWKK